MTDHKHAPLDEERLMSLAHELLLALGENPQRPGLEETPRRWASWWKEFIEYEPGITDTTFKVATSNQLVVVSGIRVYSICEHHLLPFWCDIAIGYVAREKVLGLSKFARIAQQCAHKLQLQERMIGEIADEVQRIVGTDDLAVLANGTHLCMLMRGVRTGAEVCSLITRGTFLEKPDLRADFLHLVQARRGNEVY